MSTVMMWQTKSTGSADTEKLGGLLGSKLQGGEVVELCADLGGGKTTLVKGLAKGLGSKDTVASPTFTLKKVYKGREGVQVHHFDFYRLSEPGVVADQLEESLNDPKVVTVVEWSDSVKDVLPEKRLCIEFQPVATDPDERTIHIHYAEPHTVLMREIETELAVSEP